MSLNLTFLKLQLAALCGLAVPLTILAADAQSVALSDKVKIPGADLGAGAYTFSVEDRLADRAIVRVESADKATHYLLLAVPNGKLPMDNADGVSFFTATADKSRSLHAWKCASCAAPLEFVYPKLEAVKITDDSTEPVLAVDPTYDKLPANLSADDMKVVTLWLLSPERITPENVGQGVKAVKYAQAAQPAPPPSVPAPAAPAQVQGPAPAADSATADTTSAAPVQTASRHHLPKTASNTGLLLLSGLGCLGAAVALRMKRILARA